MENQKLNEIINQIKFAKQGLDLFKGKDFINVASEKPENLKETVDSITKKLDSALNSLNDLNKESN